MTDTDKGQTGRSTPTGKRRHSGGSPPVDSRKVKVVIALARGGTSRNEIARQVGISSSTVSRICARAEPPVTFDRRATAAATEAKVYDAKARRAELARTLLEDAFTLRASAFEEQDRVHYSVTNGEQHYKTRMTAPEIRDTFVSVGILVDKHLTLERHDSDGLDLPAVDQWLADRMGRVA